MPRDPKSPFDRVSWMAGFVAGSFFAWAFDLVTGLLLWAWWKWSEFRFPWE